MEATLQSAENVKQAAKIFKENSEDSPHYDTRRSFSHYFCTGLKKARHYIQQNNSEQNIHSQKPDNNDMA